MGECDTVLPYLASKVKTWDIFPEAEDGSLIWSDEFDYTGPHRDPTFRRSLCIRFLVTCQLPVEM